MKLFGLTIERTKAVAPAETKAASNWLTDMRSWYPLIREPFTGAWQRNIHVDQHLSLSFHAVFACMTLIASDIAKLRMKLVKQDENRIWSETDSPAYSPVLRKPNAYQTRIQFWENWILSKLTRGNTYVLKERDNRNVVTGLYVLCPDRVRPMVAADGSVWYELDADNLAGIDGSRVMVPAREIIHDRWNTLFHPLCGISPLYAAGLGAMQGLRIQQNSARFFGNNSQPGGILTVDPSVRLTPAEAQQMQETWQKNYSGENIGNVAVLAGGLKFVQLSMTAQDAQLIEQHKWSAETVCGVFHVPGYKVGIGAAPLNNNVQALEVQYLAQCLQILLESAELCMDEGLGIGEGVGTPPYYGTEFDIDNLLRMDTGAQMVALKDAVGAGVMAPDEARLKINLPPTEGGKGPYLQQQNYSLAALAKRDAMDDPFGTSTPQPQPPDQPALPPPDQPTDSSAGKMMAAGRAHLAAHSLRKHLVDLMEAA